MPSNTRLVGKIFVFSLPTKEDNENACNLLKDEELFMTKILEMQGCKEIEGVNVCGVYAITFDIEESPYTDDEIIKQIDSIANDIGFDN